MKKGVSGIEFIVAVTFFLIAFWYVFIETSEMIMDKPVQVDVRQPALQFYSGYIIKNPGEPADWDENPDDFALAYYDEKTHRNILDHTKLNYANQTNCSSLTPAIMNGIDIGFKVTSQYGTWQCQNPPRKDAMITRLVYIHVPRRTQYAGTLEVWVA
ncbi:hypothetical protein K8R43_03930 [archaeon]|nr:hypothetical protein [archaeon]